MFPGLAVVSLDWSIGTSPFAGNLGSGVASGANLSQTSILTNQCGFDVNLVSISGLKVNVSGSNP